MMNTAIAKQQDGGAMLERVLIGGDLSKLTPEDRVMYYKQVCESTGLNPLTKPFEYISLNGKLVLYALRSCTEQLRKIHGVSVLILSREVVEDCYVVTARATDKTGRNDESIGAVSIQGLKGEARSNAMMKAETKAKRRVTLSICGLGMLDETEVDSIPGAYPSPISPTAGALQALPVARQEMLNETAAKMREFYANDQLFEAYTLMENSGLDTDDRVALFSLLDSKLKNALGRLGAAERAQQSGVISPAKHKRLEAIIKESKLNRQGLKDWCALQFNKTHFTELTDDEYKELDAHIASITTTAPPQESAAASSPGGSQPPAAGAVPVISGAELREIEIEVERKGIKGRFNTKLAASGIKSPDMIPADKVAGIRAWVEAAK